MTIKPKHLKALRVCLTEFQCNTINRMVGSSYGSNVSGIVRFIVQSYLMEHGDTILKDLERFEEWKKINAPDKTRS